MTKRRLRLFDPRNRHKTGSGLRLSKNTLAQIDDVSSWLVRQLWENADLRPPQWDGKITRDEALRVILHHFADAYGCPLNSDERNVECDDNDRPA